ncbi:MAG: hypothetical protein KatS3mg060_3526 [Dehalococcoidia bacterium]|nr:MAG: hypothetical protein KatS3mg060_3526 [Dehalococcoidia bacterium]
MATLHQVNVWNEKEPGPAGLAAMPPSLLWLPDDYRLGQAGGAVLFAHRWGGYPYDPPAPVLGHRLAGRGYAVLSLGLRRRGAEGQLTTLPDDDLRDVKLGVDYLASCGFDQIVLVGHEAGALSVTRYQAKTRDLRVSGVAVVDPLPDLANWLRQAVGPAVYDRQVRHATVAARQGSGLDDRADLTAIAPDGRPFLIDQYASAFLAWWAPIADTRISRAAEDLLAPLLILPGTDAALGEQLARRARAATLGPRAEDPAAVAEQLANWMAEIAPVAGAPVAVELLQTTVGGEVRPGLFYTPTSGTRSDTAYLYIPGMTGTPLGVFAKQATILAQAGLPTLVAGLRRAGRGGHRVTPFEHDLEDIRAFIDLLESRGLRRVILSGGSLGAVPCSAYQPTDPRVVALALFAPTNDMAPWIREGLGPERYDQTVQQARDAVAAGRGDEAIIEVTFRRPDPDPFHALFRYPETARAWLSRWGPDAPTRHLERIAEVTVPLLLLCGTEDNFNDRERMDAVQAAARRAPSVEQRWYEDCDHLFVRFERAAAHDLLDWLARSGVWRSSPAPRDSERSGGRGAG